MRNKRLTSQNKKKSLLEKRLERTYTKKAGLARRLDKVEKAYLEGKISKVQYVKHTKHYAYKKHKEVHENKIKRYYSELYKPKKTFTSQLIALLLVIGMLGLFVGSSLGPGVISGYVVGTRSEAVIQQYFAVGLSGNLTDGITFGTLIFDTTDNPSTDNYGGGNNTTALYMAISPNSNIRIDFCMKGNADLTNGVGDKIGLSNITWSNANTTSGTVPPGPGGSTPLTNTFVSGTANLRPGDANYFRFWLDVPDDTPPGTYNNTIEFKGVKTGQSC
jgi:hypothetical protein